MSGDVQPRKRKDKKKRKDEDGYALNEDVNIHVHKEGGTGGNICAKIVFFFLFSALIVLIGLIIKENQGLTELEDYESESRYSQIFEGWVDKNADEHEDDHSPELSHEHDDHDLDDEEEEDHYESEEDNVEETDEEQSQEVDDDDQEEEEELTTRSEEGTYEETEEEDQVPESEEDNTVEEDEDNTDEIDEQPESEDKDDSEEADVNNNISEPDENEDDDAEEDDTKEIKKSEEQSEKKAGDDDDSEEDKVADKSEEVVKDHLSREDVKEENKEDEEKEEHVNEELAKKEEKEVEVESAKQSSGMATKIGVGVALLAVAYNVFLRKRSSDSFEKPLSKTKTVSEKEPTPDLSRRNTIVPPPSLQEVEPDLPDIEPDEEEYSEEEYSDEDSRSEHRSVREEYQELRTTYTRALTPEGDFETKDKYLEEEVLEHDLDDEEELEEEELLDDEDIEDEYEKYDDEEEDEDEELLKRLEAKYGKLGRDVNVAENLESDSDREDYEHSNITNKDDFKIKEDIDAAQEHLNKNAAYANKLFEALLDKYPLSPRTLYGKAKALDILAEENQSNELLQQSLTYYMKALTVSNVPDPLFVIIAERYIDRARFIGQYKKAVAAHWQLIERFPNNSTYLNNLAVTYLTINLVEEARAVLKRVLSRWPNDGFALVHYGFILKTTDNNLEESVKYMVKGLKTKEPGVIDGRFYFHLGDALTRLNKNEEAMKYYEEGVQEKVFMSKFQRSLYNVPRLTAKPWWEPEDLPSYQKLFLALRNNWQEIRQEGLSCINDQGYFRDEAENLKDTGTWKQLELFARGQKFTKNCVKTPVTCGIIQSFPDARTCRRGQTKFSVMHPGTHVWPHCGPTNCRLRIHLGLKVPPNTFIRVAEETRSWKEGELIIFDDSFEHEVWHNGSDFRLVLIIDVWHPDLTSSEKKSLSAI